LKLVFSYQLEKIVEIVEIVEIGKIGEIGFPTFPIYPILIEDLFALQIRQGGITNGGLASQLKQITKSANNQTNN